MCVCVCVCVWEPAVADYVHLSVVRATPLCVLICFARLFMRLFPLLLCRIFAATSVLRFILCRFSNKMHNLYALVRFGGHCQFHGPFHGHYPTLTAPTHVCVCVWARECEKQQLTTLCKCRVRATNCSVSPLPLASHSYLKCLKLQSCDSVVKWTTACEPIQMQITQIMRI